GKKFIRIVFRKNSRSVAGFNLLGFRFRHELCEQWIREGKSVEYVMEHLRLANFDPEFYKQHEVEIVSKFNSENNSTLKIKARRGIFQKKASA
ncbi:MAG: hypothetical protein ABIQ74_03295, partial [Chitinophagales bacterium]